MNGLRLEAERLVGRLLEKNTAEPVEGTEVLLCPPLTVLTLVGDLVTGSGLLLGAQNCNEASVRCAHTGEVSALMLRDAGCSHVILGHSERRADQGESSGLVRAKGEAAIASGLTVVLCVGETLAERESGRAEAVVADQLRLSLPSSATPETLVVAYEPVWAIGTGRSAGTDDVARMHHALRGMLADDLAGGDAVRVLYGGSVKAANAAELLALPDVDGALVGGASLDAEEFWKIVKAAP